MLDRIKNLSRKAKLIWGGVALVLLIGIIGNFAGGGPEKNTPDQALAKAATTPAPAAFVLPDYTGKTLDVALKEMTVHGIEAKTVDTVDGKTVLSPKNWNIESHSPAPGASVVKGDIVTFNVSKPGAAEAKATADAAAAAKAKEPTETSQGLDASTATVACDHVGEAQFRYGFKAHWALGGMAQRIEDDHWFMKVSADVTNEYGAKMKGVTVECTVGGTADNPEVTGFDVY